MARDHFLDLVGIDVEAGDQDHVLLAVDDLGVAASRPSRRCRRCGRSRPRSSPSRSRPAGSSSRPSPAGPWRRSRRPGRAALRCRRRRGSRYRSTAPEGRSMPENSSMSAGLQVERRRRLGQPVAFRQRAAGDLQPFLGDRPFASPCRRRYEIFSLEKSSLSNPGVFNSAVVERVDRPGSC